MLYSDKSDFTSQEELQLFIFCHWSVLVRCPTSITTLFLSCFMTWAKHKELIHSNYKWKRRCRRAYLKFESTETAAKVHTLNIPMLKEIWSQSLYTLKWKKPPHKSSLKGTKCKCEEAEVSPVSVSASVWTHQGKHSLHSLDKILLTASAVL